MKLCSLFSGGKDSTYALHWAILKGFKVTKLITLIPARDDSWMFQYHNVKFTTLQAESMDIPILLFNSSGDKDKEMDDLRRAMEACASSGDEGVLSGALLSDYQRMRINLIAEELNMRAFSPLWRKDQESYMRSILRDGFKFMITHSASMGFPHSLVGKVMEEEDLERVISASRRYGFNPAFEGGEAETFVVEAPLFRKRIRVKGERTCVTDSCTFEIKEAELDA